MRLIIAPALSRLAACEVHDDRERFAAGAAKAGGVLYVGLHGGHVGTVLTEGSALTLVGELLRWASERWGAGAVLAELPEELLRAELARRHARSLREGLGDPAKLVAERHQDLSQGAGRRSISFQELCNDLERFGLTPEEVRRELVAGHERRAWSLPEGTLPPAGSAAADCDADLRARIKEVLRALLPFGWEWTLEGVQRFTAPGKVLEGYTAEQVAEAVTALVKAGEVQPRTTGGLVLREARKEESA